MTTQIKQTVKEQCKKAFEASRSLISLSTTHKNDILRKMADSLIQNCDHILMENKKDLVAGKEIGTSDYLLDRLKLDEVRLEGIAESIRTVSTLEDPIGEIISKWTRPNGLKISKIRVPLGVIGMIYEARPNVTADAASLTFKTGNSVVLRGSSSAYRSNKAIIDAIKTTLQENGVNPDCIQLLEDTTRESVKDFVTMNEYLSLIIPRGGAGLIQRVVNEASVPTIETGVGNCHVYVDKDADLEKAKSIVFNSKTHRPSVCNSCESLIIHENIAKEFLPELFEQLRSEGVEIRGCEVTRAIDSKVIAATIEDWGTEYLDLTISVKIVSSLQDAIEHITRYGTFHTEAIVTENTDTAAIFTKQVDASAVLVNTSTRFTDGGEFGFGAEIGISTQKLHARGPMGLTEITSYKYIVEGTGQVR
jgi:glutamate-5-semialdehyde dehydrogenase